MRSRVLQLAGVALALTGRAAPQEKDATVELSIDSLLAMPFHGPNGPGTEPMSIGFNETLTTSFAFR